MAHKNSVIEVDCWADMGRMKGNLYFSVAYSGEQVSKERRDSMFKVAKHGSWSSIQTNFNLYVSKQLCKAL